MNAIDEPERFAFIDFEASSLSSGSFPCEVGTGTLHREEPKIRSASWLIRPLAKWLRVSSAWDPKSETLTAITREMLEEHGVAARDVVERLLAVIGERSLFSDEPSFDQHWLRQLFEAAGVGGEPPKLDDATRSEHSLRLNAPLRSWSRRNIGRSPMLDGSLSCTRA